MKTTTQTDHTKPNTVYDSIPCQCHYCKGVRALADIGDLFDAGCRHRHRSQDGKKCFSCGKEFV